MSPLFKKMKARILGARFDLSFSYLGPTAMRRLNKKYRKKDAPTDVLAFPLDKARGEIVMCKSVIAKKAPQFGMRASDYHKFLFIHAALHLKSYDHGRIMTRLEDRWCRAFGIPLPKR